MLLVLSIGMKAVGIMLNAKVVESFGGKKKVE